MFEKIKPLYDRVLVERVQVEDTTPAGIVIPPAAQEKAQTGRVIATGQGRLVNGKDLAPLAVKAGDVVYFGKYAGTEAGDNHIIIREDEILGVVEKI